ncbi:MAG: TRAP transporter large permease subunit [Treponema porcinum]|uniref:SLC13 family permease n=1 Tax=Treponema porcinum TaxID=261392 RepID=UPI002356AE16|nr:SLC13 family permease [Treponema porcinum]MCI6815835.1 TRAP transporter large permease subunit [Treponema porcinum]
MDIKWIVLIVAVVMYLLVILKQDKKVWFTTGAALLLVALGTVLPGAIFNDGNGGASETGRLFAVTHSLGTLINWNVLMIYIGSMIIAALFIYSKVPARIADSIVEKSPGSGIAIIMILAMTGIISIFVENVATVLVMAPIALALSKKLKLNPTYFLSGLAVMSNLEGTATLVGDPPSMIFASFAGYTFNDFFFYGGKISIFFFVQTGLLAGCIFFYMYFRNAKEKTAVDRTKVVSFVPAVLLVAMIAGLALLSFLHFDWQYGSGVYVMVLGIAGIVWYVLSQKKSGEEVRTLIKELDWETIFFLCGIFVVVGAISETGLLKEFAAFLADVTGGNKLFGFVLILLVSIFISGFVDNVPYIIVMLPVAADLALNLGIHKELYMFALLIGSCLGGNLTPFGASANVVAMGILKKEGYPLSFKGWLKIGALFTFFTTLSAALFLWFVWK